MFYNYFKTIFFIFSLSFVSISALAYDFKYIQDIQVGKEPVGIFYDSIKSQFHIICKGADKDFDGQHEPADGDSLPNWWTLKLDKTGNILELKKVKDFAFGSIPFPFRPAFVPEVRKIFINHYDGIVSYNLDNFEAIGEKIDLFGVTGLDYHSGHLLISQSSFAGKVDTAILFDVAQNKTINKYPVGINLNQAKMFQPANPNYKGIAAISIGGFGSDSSRLHHAIFPQSEKPLFNDTLIGNTANSIDIIDDRFLVVPVMMSNKLVVTDLKHDFYFTEIQLGEPSWDGPSFSKFSKINELGKMTEYLLFTTTYSGWFEIYSLKNEDFPVGGSSKELRHITGIDLKNKGEALDFSTIYDNGSLNIVVANSLKPDYSSNNTVSLITLTNIFSTVEEKNQVSNKFIVNENSIEFLYDSFNNSIFEIYDLYGNRVAYTINSKIIPLYNLSSGIYFAKFTMNNDVYLYKFNYTK